MQKGVSIKLWILVLLIVIINVFSFFIAFQRIQAIKEYSNPLQQQNLPATGAAGNIGGISIIILGDEQKENITQGWSFISFYVYFNNKSITSVLSSVEGKYDYILEWNSSSQEFNSWSRIGTKQFTEFNENKSYFIYFNQAAAIDLSGRFYTNKTIPLELGWESPDYIYEYSSNITNRTFYGINFTYMQKWNVSSQEFLVYSPKSSSPQFTLIEAGEGYLILTEGGNITYIRK